MRESLTRKVSVEPRYLEAKEFQMYSRRLVKDLEAKGFFRTAVESLNLQLHGHREDVTMAECIRTFPTVTFHATLPLKREEVDTLKVTGASIIAALHQTKVIGRTSMRRMTFCMVSVVMLTSLIFYRPTRC